MSPLSDPASVRQEYADESRLSVRASAWTRATGPDAVTLSREAVAEVSPQRVLDVGCGRGEASEWIARETGAVVVAVDQSERMVELTRARGIDARVGDVQELPFEDASFDAVLAAWMLYHVPDVDRGIAEIARVLRPGGRFVAVTNSSRHARELKELVNARFTSVFSAENGEEILSRHFATVDRRDAEGYVDMDAEEALAYLGASTQWEGDRTTELDGPIRVTKAAAIFVATK